MPILLPSASLITDVAAYWTTRCGDRVIYLWLPPRGGEHCGEAEVDQSCHRESAPELIASDCNDVSIR